LYELSIGTKIGDLERPLNGEMALVWRYFTEFGSFSGELRKSG